MTNTKISVLKVINNCTEGNSTDDTHYTKGKLQSILNFFQDDEEAIKLAKEIGNNNTILFSCYYE